MFHRHYTTGRYRGQNKQERAIMLCMTSWHHHASLPHPSPLMFLPNTKGYPCNTDTKGWKTNPFPPVGSSKEWLPVRAVSIKHFTFHWVCLLQAVLHPHLLVCPLLPCYILKGKSSQHWTQVTECASMLKPPQVCSSTSTLKPPQVCSSTSTLKPPLVCSSTIHLLATQVQNKKLMFHAQRQATGLHLVTFLGLVHWSWRNQMSGPHLLTLLGLVLEAAGTRCMAHISFFSLVFSLEAAGTRCMAHISFFLVFSLEAAGTRCVAHISSFFLVFSLEATGTKCMAHIS